MCSASRCKQSRAAAHGGRRGDAWRAGARTCSLTCRKRARGGCATARPRCRSSARRRLTRSCTPPFRRSTRRCGGALSLTPRQTIATAQAAKIAKIGSSGKQVRGVTISTRWITSDRTMNPAAARPASRRRRVSQIPATPSASVRSGTGTAPASAQPVRAQHANQPSTSGIREPAARQLLDALARGTAPSRAAGDTRRPVPRRAATRSRAGPRDGAPRTFDQRGSRSLSSGS